MFKVNSSNGQYYRPHVTQEAHSLRKGEAEAVTNHIQNATEGGGGGVKGNNAAEAWR
jgi:hypothetical protein